MNNSGENVIKGKNIADNSVENVIKPKNIAGGGSNRGLKGIVAGSLTGAIEICITYPLEYIKTQLQLDAKGDKQYAGVVDCAFITVKDKGFFGLYRGLSILLLGSIPKSAVRFGSFETISSFFRTEDGKLSSGYSFLSGLGAGVTEAILAVTPMETIKVKLINDQRSANPQYRGLIHGVGQIIKSEGISGIYKGLPATIMKQGSNQALRFCTMNILKDLYTEGDPYKRTPKPVVACFGGIAGAVSVFGNNPIDVVKTRMQGLEASKYKNTFDCFMQILKNEGVGAFYKGTAARLSRVCADVAITFTLYDYIMELINMVFH